MARRRKRTSLQNDGLKLTDKQHPKLGIISTMLAFATIIVFAIVCFQAGENNGSADISSAVIGILCFVSSVAGFALAWISLRQENIRTLFPTIGAIMNGITMLGLLLLYAWGSSL